jgi:hypothetical protein
MSRTSLSPVLDEMLDMEGVKYIFYRCPGCSEHHWIPVTGPKAWGFDGNLESPTVTPSVKHTWHEGEERTPKCCHYFLRAGRFEYCGDCTHSLAGQTVPMPTLAREPEKQQT